MAYAGLAQAYFERDIWGGLGIGKSAIKYARPRSKRSNWMLN